MTERELIERLTTLLCSRMTRAGHLAQVVVQEGRGNCLPPSGGCTPACEEAGTLILEADAYLARTELRQPTLFDREAV